jgi:23S rRNA pseudouridine2605 synthase
MASQPVIKALSSAGVDSRRKIAEAIKAGSVTVNGKPVENFNHPVDSIKDEIIYKGKPVGVERNKKVYLIINKPKGVVSTTQDRNAEKTIMELIPEKYKNYHLYPVGRLDKDSTGLLLMTNDGDLTYQVTHPRFEHEKEYLVKLSEKLDPQAIAELKRGIDLEEGKTSPVVIRTVSSSPFNYSIVIHEGRKRQIRRMFAHLGYIVLELKRIRIGGLKIGDLPEGSARELTVRELKSLLTG